MVLAVIFLQEKIKAAGMKNQGNFEKSLKKLAENEAPKQGSEKKDNGEWIIMVSFSFINILVKNFFRKLILSLSYPLFYYMKYLLKKITDRIEERQTHAESYQPFTYS